MLLILAVLAVITADTYGENFAPQRDNNTNSIRHPECDSFVPEVFKSTVTVLICVPGVESTFKSINEKWIKNPIWDDGIASEALKEAHRKHSTHADFKLFDYWYWSKEASNKTTLIQKVESRMRLEPILHRGFFKTMYDYYRGELNKPLAIPKNIYYGCNGIFTLGSGRVDVMTTVCLYRKDRKKKWWKVYKSVEV